MNKTDSSVVSGFRLETLEILNWGTFNGNIYRITPGGATSLLTGANGSGKSTIVDALLTLLVPNLRRNYNLASGSEQKRERDEKSYVLGAFGRRRSESDNITRVEYLRNRNSYSVLLARFHDEANSHDVTLVQIFYFQNDSLMKFQVAAETALEIKNDFSGFTSIRELRKKLRERQGVEVFDNFSDYAGAFRRLLGLESEKALDLFNQTVSIKEIGNLNDFIRRHMLERPDVEGRIDTLRKNFDNLDAAHKAIIRAADQLEKLNPLVNLLDSYDAILAEIRQCVMLQSIIPVYFAEMKLDLVNRALSGIDEKLRSLQNQTASLDHELEKRQEEELNLRQSIEQNSDALRLKELLREKQNLEKELNNRREQSIRYNRLAGLVELITEPAEKTFYQNREKSAERLAGHTAVLEKLQIQRDENTIALSKLQSEEKVLTEEVESLLSRSSQIPASLHRERACAAAELGIDENMLPFAGEIIKVRDDCRELEGIIEFILRPFALSILVPAEHAAAFSRYINKKDLSRKISFIITEEIPGQWQAAEIKNRGLKTMLDINPGTRIFRQIDSFLSENYYHAPVKSVDTLLREEKSFTAAGLIHEKINHLHKGAAGETSDRSNFVLGWDNKEKIKLLTAELQTLKKNAALHERNISLLASRTADVRAEAEHLRDLLLFTDYSDIDIKSVQAQIRENEKAVLELEKSSDSLRILRNQLEKCRSEITALRTERDQTTRNLVNTERDKKDLENSSEECRAILDSCEKMPDDLQKQQLALRCHGSEASVRSITHLEKKVTFEINSQEREKNRIREQHEKKLLLQMERFKHAWPEDTLDLDANIEAGKDFRALQKKLQHDDLPRYQKRFKELLDEKVILDVSSFYNFLNKEAEQIQEKINELNGSLSTIDYTHATFIHLNCEKTQDIQIKEFQLMLRESFEGIGTRASPERNDLGFRRIKKIIERFDSEEYWTKKVTDVRNWLEFSASERYRSSGEEKSYYSDSSGKSGGQKAKLAYTILASAVCFQYGIRRRDYFSRSFRFVVIDEAFSKSDDTNSRYAMELFATLGLQLLVVSPLDKTQVVEPYISACHFVTNNENEDCSSVYNLGMDEYFLRKKQAAL